MTYQRQGAMIAMALLLVIDFAAGVSLPDLAVQASTLAIIALGMTLVVVTGGIDLSVGSVYALSAVASAYASRGGVVLALVVPLAVGALTGMAQGWLIGRKRIPSFVVTLCGLLFVRGLLRLIATEGHETYVVPWNSGFLWFGQLTVIVTVVLYVLGGLLLQRTPFGMRLFAVGGSENASTLMGVPVVRTKISVYVLSGVLAGLAGALSAAHLGVGLTGSGLWSELEAVLAVVLGGTVLTGGMGAVSGTLVGVGLWWGLRGLINQAGGMSMNVQAVLCGALLVVVVVAQAVFGWFRRPR